MCCSFMHLKLKHFCLQSFVQPLVTMDETTMDPGRSARIRARMEASIKLRAELMESPRRMARAEAFHIENQKERHKLREQRIADRKNAINSNNAINSQLEHLFFKDAHTPEH